jgi:DNA-binding transcriptional LysR family regulator
VETHRIRYFLSIAEEGSINRAATVLGVAQPALSRQVRLLEEELGVSLFNRTARGVQLTEEGERLRAATAAPLRQLELAMRYAGSPLARIERGLHLGLPETAAPVLAAPLLNTLSAAFPKVAIRLTVASADDLFKEMLRGSIDIAVTSKPSDDRLFYGEILEEDVVVVGPATSDLRPESPLPFSDLMAQSIVLPASRSGVRASIENTALRLKHTVLSTIETDSLSATLDLIAAGHGFGVMPLSACAIEVGRKQLRYAPLSDPALTSTLGVTVASKTELSRGLTQRISEIARDEIARLIRSKAWPARLMAVS